MLRRSNINNYYFTGDKKGRWLFLSQDLSLLSSGLFIPGAPDILTTIIKKNSENQYGILVIPQKNKNRQRGRMPVS